MRRWCAFTGAHANLFQNSRPVSDRMGREATVHRAQHLAPVTCSLMCGNLRCWDLVVQIGSCTCCGQALCGADGAYHANHTISTTHTICTTPSAPHNLHNTSCTSSVSTSQVRGAGRDGQSQMCRADVAAHVFYLQLHGPRVLHSFSQSSHRYDVKMPPPKSLHSGCPKMC